MSDFLEKLSNVYYIFVLFFSQTFSLLKGDWREGGVTEGKKLKISNSEFSMILLVGNFMHD